ncbi:MAG TPA: D-alanyl-D-alanine carboxypeptidase [Hyphomicrobiaceae bacterium]|nr:D-alanyl-D-alanine carboxypeptidase [Hyphomicrobiaceae bacterium]
MFNRPTSRTIVAACAFAVLLAPPAGAGGRYAAMVVDANTGAALHAEAPDERRHPASLAKMMTLYLVFEAIERGRIGYGTRIPVSPAAAAAPPSRLGLEPGSEIALVDAIKALITKSANDVAIAVAEYIAGSEEAFARLMTTRAHQLGMTATQFRNASGLHHPEQVTTARDMLRLALRLQDDFPAHYRLFSLRTFSYGGREYRNHNLLLGTFPGTDGIKTGYIAPSGFNLVASVRRGKRHVIGVVFGGRNAKSRDAAMSALLTRALRQASPVFTRKREPVLIALPRPARRSAPALPAVASAVPSPPRLEPARPDIRSPAGLYEVQVGAFNTTAEAERALSLARNALAPLLEAYPARTIPYEMGDRRLYRARFGGFSEEVAAAACLKLRRQRIDCFVSRAE